jgi:hypothetical protein
MASWMWTSNCWASLRFCGLFFCVHEGGPGMSVLDREAFWAAVIPAPGLWSFVQCPQEQPKPELTGSYLPHGGSLTDKSVLELWPSRRVGPSLFRSLPHSLVSRVFLGLSGEGGHLLQPLHAQKPCCVLSVLCAGDFTLALELATVEAGHRGA